MTDRVITIRVDSSGVQSGSRDVEKALKGIERQADRVKREVRGAAQGKPLEPIKRGATEAKKDFRELGNEVDKTSARIRRLRSEQAKSQARGAGGGFGGGGGAGGGAGGAGGGFKSVQDGANRARVAVGGLAAQATALIGILTAGAIIRAADGFAALQGQLRLVTNSTSELTETTQTLFNIAQETRQGLDATASLYIRLSRATDFASERVEGLTETISKSIALSRAAPESARAALFQLGQGFAAGALRGEELNSVLEQTPELAKAIADGLGVTLGELRLLGAEGELTAEKVAGALENSAERVASEFGDIPLTVSDAVTRAGNSLTFFIGQVDQATGATSGLASVINAASETITGLGIIISGASGFGARFDEVGEQVEEAEAKIRKLQETASGFQSTSQSNFGGFKIISKEDQEIAETALAGAIADLERLKKLQNEILFNGGLTNAEKEAKALDLLRTNAAKAADVLNGLFLNDAARDQLADAIDQAREKLAELRNDPLIDEAELSRIELLINNSIAGASQRSADAFVANFEGARQKAEAQLELLNRFVSDNLIPDDVASRIREKLASALAVPPDPAIEAAQRFVDSFATAAEKTQDRIDQLDDFIEANLIPEETAVAIRARLEAILAKELIIPVSADVQALEDTEQRIADLQGRIEAFNTGGAEGLSAFESFIEARDIIAELGDNATVTVQELTTLIETEKALEGVLEDTTSKVAAQGDVLEDFYKRARENSQDILAGFLADPLSEGLDELPAKFAQTLQQLAAQALASQIFDLLLGAQGTSGGGFLGSILGAFGGGKADGGPVTPNSTFLVGERGPELFTPSSAGSITSNERLGQMAAPQVNVAGPTIINALDANEVVAAGLGANGGVILNQVTEQRDAFRQALGIGAG